MIYSYNIGCPDICHPWFAIRYLPANNFHPIFSRRWDLWQSGFICPQIILLFATAAVHVCMCIHSRVWVWVHVDMCVSVCALLYMHLCDIHVCMWVYVLMCVHVQAHMYTLTHMWVCTSVCMWVCVSVCMLNTCMSMCVLVHMYMSMCTLASSCVYVSVHTLDHYAVIYSAGQSRSQENVGWQLSAGN